MTQIKHTPTEMKQNQSRPIKCQVSNRFTQISAS
jgi:hypothetical protein